MVKAYQAGREKSTIAHRLSNTKKSLFHVRPAERTTHIWRILSAYVPFQLPAGLSRSGGNFKLFEDILQRDLVPLQLVPELHPHS